jgi:hypothetical protein
MSEEVIRKQCAYEESLERDLAAGNSWDEINYHVNELCRIVQTGKRVSREQMLEVDRQLKGPNGFLGK